MPTLADVLAWCEAAGPGGWFPADRASDGPVRETLYQHTMDLRRLGYIEVVEWVRGKGQGFVLTDAGRLKLGRPIPVPPVIVPSQSHSGPATPATGDRAEPIDPRPAVVAPALVIACLTWFAVGLYLAMTAGTTTTYLVSGDVPTLTRTGAAFGPSLYAGQWWRLAVSGFVHIGVLHLLLNGYGLYLSGSTAEALWGRRKIAVIFAVSVVAGSALATALRPTSLLAGASGGIWGVLLSIVAWIVLNRHHVQGDWLRDAASRVGFAVLVNALASAVPGVSWEAHLGGGVAGFFTACLLHSVRPGAGWGGRIAVGTLALAVLTAGLAYRKFVTTAARWEPVRRQVERRVATPPEANPKLVELNAKSAAIPWERIQSLHATGSVAVASGSAKRMAVVRELAGQLKGEADLLAAEFESLHVAMMPAESRDRVVRSYRNLAAFATSVLDALDDPHPARAWVRTKEPFRRVSESYREASTPPGR
jgi:rhomboid protease GluP